MEELKTELHSDKEEIRNKVGIDTFNKVFESEPISTPSEVIDRGESEPT